ncbi:alpha/beta hydrolase [Bacillus solimangrovi]|uniref:Serine aminopeptidase S33 domain-containing protein n=1 Tax=Bacillus solimangrovi TaxID=1305675 RepID=A0A1E5LKH2_9BACI|nr:alpha/beta hydrolase [Bacillus solimangrovi]OEH94536.1 hypothetical protein BFG57_07655 [Bacillus solimangrovi]
MERVSFANSRNLRLIGNYYSSESNSIIIMCHGFRNDKSSNGRFDRFARTLNDQGYSVLAFDFSGCGESDDDSLSLYKFVDDLKAVIHFVKSMNYCKIALFGHSLGSRVCLEAFNKQHISTIVMTGAGTGPVAYNWYEHFSKAQMKELQETGYFTHYKEGCIRNKMVIERQMLLDFEQFEQQPLLSRITVPVLLIHGDDDDEEKMLSEISKSGLRWLPKGSQLRVIEGASHSFMGHLDIVEQLAVNWFAKHFPINNYET